MSLASLAAGLSPEFVAALKLLIEAELHNILTQAAAAHPAVAAVEAVVAEVVATEAPAVAPVAPPQA